MSQLVEVNELSPTHFLRFPVWRYVPEREAELVSDTMVRPVERLPVDDLSLCLVGCKVSFADGELAWAVLSNIEVWDALSTEQFLTIGLFLNDQIFHLERYHDFEYEKYGPKQLAAFLGKQLEEVFPISYDLTPFSKGDPAILKGSILAEPPRRLSRAQLRRLIAGESID